MKRFDAVMMVLLVLAIVLANLWLGQWFFGGI